MIFLVLTFSIASFCSHPVAEALWPNGQRPTRAEFQHRRQTFTESLLTAEEALQKTISIGQAALDQCSADHHLANPYILNLTQVSSDIVKTLTSFLDDPVNEDNVFCCTATRHTLRNAQAHAHFCINIILTVIDDFMFSKDLYNHPKKQLIYKSIQSATALSSIPTILHIQSQQDLKTYLMQFPGPILSKPAAFQDLSFSQDPLFLEDENAKALFQGATQRIAPKLEATVHSTWLACAVEAVSPITCKYTFSESGFFYISDDSMALAQNINLLSLHTSIPEQCYAKAAHQEYFGLAAIHAHDFSHFIDRDYYHGILESALEPVIPTEQSTLCLMTEKVLDYIEENWLDNDTRPALYSLFNWYQCFSCLHECSNPPTFGCSVKSTLQQIWATLTLTDADFANMITTIESTFQYAFQKPPSVEWSNCAEKLATHLAPHFKYKKYEEKHIFSSSQIYPLLPKASKSSGFQCILTKQSVYEQTFLHKNQKINPFTHLPSTGSLETGFLALGKKPSSQKEFNFSHLYGSSNTLSLREFYEAKYNTAPPPQEDPALACPTALSLNQVRSNSERAFIRALDLAVRLPEPNNLQDILPPSREFKEITTSLLPASMHQEDPALHGSYAVQSQLVCQDYLPTQPPHPYTIYFSAGQTPFTYISCDAYHKKILICSPALTKAQNPYHLLRLSALHFFLTDDLTHYCCPEHIYHDYSLLNFSGHAQHAISLVKPRSTSCPTTSLPGRLSNIVCTCQETNPFSDFTTKECKRSLYL